MGAADLVPGISGGTVAFILGYYEEFIDAIKTIHLDSIFGKRRLAWPFLLLLLSGMLLSFATLSQPIAQILNHEKWRSSLFSTFLGLVLASALICIRKVNQWRSTHILTLLITAITIYFVTNIPSTSVGTAPIGVSNDLLIDPWIMLCGAIGVCAMLLPGISGSYLLTVLGVYPRVIGAVADFSQGLKSFSLNIEACLLLSNFLVGVVLGALFFSRVISWLFARYHDLTIAMLIGFMLGALRSIWPFWSYRFIPHPFKPEKGMVLETIAPILPPLEFEQFVVPLLFMILAFAAVVGIEFLVQLKFTKTKGYAEVNSKSKF